MTWRDFFGAHLREARDVLAEEPAPGPRTCPHGLAFRNMQLPPGGWNGGVSECACCYGTFGYIDWATYGPGRARSHTWTPKSRCATCGGAYVDYDSGAQPEPALPWETQS